MPAQRQDSLIDQLRDLRVIANKHGMYDAADYLRNVIAESDRKVSYSEIAEVARTPYDTLPLGA